jgi:hypothetical protein
MAGVRSVNRLVLAIALFAGLGTQAPAKAEVPTFLELHRHLEGVAWGVIWHEAGHALIDIAGLSLVGPEEDIADEFAVMMMIDYADADNSSQREYLDRMMDSWFFFWSNGDSNQDMQEMLDVHSVSLHRAYNILCLVVGAFPARDYELESNLFDDSYDRDRCIWAYPKKRAAWDKLLGPLRNPATTAAGLTNVELQAPDSAPADRFYQNRYLQLVVPVDAMRYLEYRFLLPQPLAVLSASPAVTADCKGPNAFYDPAVQSIVLCTNFWDLFADSYVKAVTGLNYSDWFAAALAQQVASAESWLLGTWRAQLPDEVLGPRQWKQESQQLALGSDGAFTTTWEIVGVRGSGEGYYGIDGDRLWLLYTGWEEDDCLDSSCWSNASKITQFFDLDLGRQVIVYDSYEGTILWRPFERVPPGN